MNYWALSTYVLFISVMESVNKAQFLNDNFLLALVTASPAASIFGTVIVSLRTMYTSL